MGSSIDVLQEVLKLPTYIRIFAENFYRFETVFCIMILWFSLRFICVLWRAKILPQIYTRIIASLKLPPIRALYARKISPQIYTRIAVRLESVWAIDWALVYLRSFVSCFVCAVIVWIRSFLMIGRCQNLIVKAW